MRKAGSRDLRGELPADWRERAIGILTSEGVTCPAPTPRWRLLASDLAELAGLSISPVAFLFVAALIADAARRLHFPDAVGKAAELVVVLMFVGLPVIVIFVLWPRAQTITRRIRMDWHIGRDPIHALRTAKRPPVLYLRSFSFDEVSSKPSKWFQFLYTLWAGGAGYPTPELSLVLAVSRFAPVLAIGRPGQTDVSIGALRFHIEDQRWQEKVRALTPLCPLIIWTTGHTEGLRWEIGHLVRSVPPERLLLWLHLPVEKLSQRQRELKWTTLVDEYASIFPRSLPSELQSMRFIAFEDDWTPIGIPGRRFRPSWRERLEPSTLGLRNFLKARLQQRSP